MIKKQISRNLAKAAACAIVLSAFHTAARGADEKSAYLDLPKTGATVSSRLLQAAEAARTKSVSLGSALKSVPVATTANGVYVDVTMESVDDSSGKLFAFPGVRVAHVSTRWNTVTLEVTNPAAIEQIANVPGAVLVQPVSKSKARAGAVQNEAVIAHRVDTVSARYGLTGAGQKIGVISDSFAVTDGVRDNDTTPARGAAGILQGAKNQDSGDLPAQVEILRDIDVPDDGTDEGAGMAELIHDIAPGAAIAFSSSNPSEAAFADGITGLRGLGCTVLVDDIIYFAEPVFQPGRIAQSAKACVQAGIPYFSAAGNEANLAIRTEYKDINLAVDDQAFPPSGVDFHQWANGTAFLPVTVIPGDTVIFSLQWNQPFQSLNAATGSQIDLDAYFVTEPTLAAVQAQANSAKSLEGLASFDKQSSVDTATGDPVEILGVFNGGFVPVTFYLVVEHYSGNQDYIPQNTSTPLVMQVNFFGALPDIQGISDSTNKFGGPAIYGHAAVPEVVAVGAVPYYDTPPYNVEYGSTATIDPESFTSLGGTLTTYFNELGVFSPTSTLKPDIAAVDGGNTTFFGSDLDLQGYNGEPNGKPNFFGTSAAAPNAAAIAALMKSIIPGLTPAQILQRMQSTAIDVTGRRAAVGFDDTTGAGLIDANAVLTQLASEAGLQPVATPTPTPVPQQTQTFDFEGGNSQGWAFTTPPFFVPATSSIDPNGALVLGSNDNTFTFGYFGSGTFSVGSSPQSGDITLQGTNGTDSLFRATYLVGGDVTDRQLTPVFRMRASTANFEQTAELVITSNTPANISAASGITQSYNQYFGLPSTQTRFRLFFDIINAGGVDQAMANFSVLSVTLEARTVGSLFGGRTDKTYAFAGSTRGWTARDAAPSYSRPVMLSDGVGLRIGPASSATNGSTFFGYWGSPEGDAAPVLLQQDRLYRAMFKISTTATLEQKPTLPAFRLRMNDSTLNYGADLVVESISSASLLPSGGSPQSYPLFFEGRSEFQNSPILFSFDYLLTGDSGNDAGLIIRLESLTVQSYVKPE